LVVWLLLQLAYLGVAGTARGSTVPNWLTAADAVFIVEAGEEPCGFTISEIWKANKAVNVIQFGKLAGGRLPKRALVLITVGPIDATGHGVTRDVELPISDDMDISSVTSGTVSATYTRDGNAI
jgi:hypothetical protein